MIQLFFTTMGRNVNILYESCVNLVRVRQKYFRIKWSWKWDLSLLKYELLSWSPHLEATTVMKRLQSYF
uniref:Uncharacterized protein n=1 Tax=Hyaloperonospora arabidopsidis (strain Emoy2) TaxID=559515 RepID=M4BEG6_HYAAE